MPQIIFKFITKTANQLTDELQLRIYIASCLFSSSAIMYMANHETLGLSENNVINCLVLIYWCLVID